MPSGAQGTADHEHEHAHKVLVVEDTADTRDSLVMLLRGEGFEAHGVANGLEALRELRRGYEPCLILLDLWMPVMDGWTFRFEQRRDPTLADIPVVVLTATVSPEEEARRVGAVAGMQKPLDVPVLLKLVGEHCPRANS
jgi:CheY-like chemotaxis protein